MKQKLLLFYDIEDRYSGETAGAFPKVKRNLLEAAQNYLGGGALAMLEGRISRKDRLLAELDALGIWFREEQCFLDCDWLGRLSAVSSGAEHEVFFDPDTQLAIKVTRPGAFGHSVVGPSLSALLSEYLTRWALHNQLFGESVRFLGALKNESGFQLVISQVWIASRLDCPTASEQEIEDYFEEFGFQKVSHLEVPVFFNPTLDLVVLDAQPHNVLKDDAGNLVSIDPWLREQPQVEVIESYFEGDEYERRLAQTDVMVLPYRSPYQLRVSRVVIEAMLNGMPVIATRGSTLFEQAEQYGVVIGCEGGGRRVWRRQCWRWRRGLECCERVRKKKWMVRRRVFRWCFFAN